MEDVQHSLFGRIMTLAAMLGAFALARKTVQRPVVCLRSRASV